MSTGTQGRLGFLRGLGMRSLRFRWRKTERRAHSPALAEACAAFSSHVYPGRAREQARAVGHCRFEVQVLAARWEKRFGFGVQRLEGGPGRVSVVPRRQQDKGAPTRRLTDCAQHRRRCGYRRTGDAATAAESDTATSSTPTPTSLENIDVAAAAAAAFAPSAASAAFCPPSPALPAAASF